MVSPNLTLTEIALSGLAFAALWCGIAFAVERLVRAVGRRGAR